MRIFVCSTDELQDAASFDAASLIVDPARKKKLLKIHSPADARRSLGAGLLLAYAFEGYQKGTGDFFARAPGAGRIEEIPVSELLAVPKQVFLYREAAGGKPYLEGESGFHFSLSHSGAYALCACAPFEIGADLQITDRQAGDNLAGKIMTQKEFDFYQMVNHAVETNITAINSKGLHIMVNIDKTIPSYLIGDELRLTQILNNLLSNAVKFTSVGYINIEVTKTVQFDDEIELFFVVSDTGIGVSQEEKDKLFKSFSQVDASITRKYGGTGLGLAITRQLVELMHGSIHLESEKGKGSSFSYSVRLRVAQNKKEENSVREQFEFINQNQDMSKFDNIGEIFQFGTEENHQEIRNKMEKLIICMEVGAWDKAETFSHNIKELVEEGPQDLKKTAFRLEMNVRKEKYEKALEQYNSLKELLEENIGGI